MAALIALLFVGAFAYVQKAPANPLPKHFRQNFCAELKAVQNNSVYGYGVLKGRTLNVGYSRDNPDAYTTNAIVAPYLPTDGFIVSLFAEFQRRAFFHLNYVLTPNVTSFTSSTAFVQAVVPYVDVQAGQPLGDIATRRQLGFGAVNGVADNTVLLIAQVRPILALSRPYVGPI